LHQFTGAPIVFPQFPSHCAFYSGNFSFGAAFTSFSSKSFRADPSRIGAASIARRQLGDVLVERYRILVLYDTGEELTAETKSLFSAELAFRRCENYGKRRTGPKVGFLPECVLQLASLQSWSRDENATRLCTVSKVSTLVSHPQRLLCVCGAECVSKSDDDGERARERSSEVLRTQPSPATQQLLLHTFYCTAGEWSFLDGSKSGKLSGLHATIRRISCPLILLLECQQCL
jgi:hypothetical protein